MIGDVGPFVRTFFLAAQIFEDNRSVRPRGLIDRHHRRQDFIFDLD
jgi:hypothetical protein